MTSYFEYVSSLAASFPRLQLLADFMSPHIKISKYHSKSNVNQRLHKVDVTVIDIGDSPATKFSFNNILELSAHIDAKSPSTKIRVILVEDVSADVIELLGSKFYLDPRFFENQVRDITKFLAENWEGDRNERLESCMSEVLSRDFLMLNFARLYAIADWDVAWEARLRLNVPRWGNMVRNLCLQEGTSVYGPIGKLGERKTFIILCDPLLDNELPRAVHLRRDDNLPKFDATKKYQTANPIENKQISTRSRVESALMKSSSLDVEVTRTLIIKTIIEVALDFCTAAIEELSLRRYRLDSNYYNRPKESYKTMLEKFNLSGGWLNMHKYIGKSLLSIKSIGIRMIVDAQVKNDLNLEIESIEIAHERAHRYMSEVLEFLKSEQQIQFTRSVERLTTITFLFLPFSTMATILSIDDTMRFGVFFALAIPIFMICVAIGIQGTSLRDLANEMQKFGHRLTKFIRIKKQAEQSVPRSSANDLEAVSTEYDLQSFRDKVFEAKIGHDMQGMKLLMTEMSFRQRMNTRKDS